MGNLSKMERDFGQMYIALQRIKKYDTPERMRRESEKDWGLQFDECIEMAYENIQQEAKNGLKGVRIPESLKPPKPGETPAT